MSGSRYNPTPFERFSAAFPEAALLRMVDAEPVRIATYRIKQDVVLLTEFTDGSGWDLYVPVADTLDIDETYAALRTWLGRKEPKP